MENSSYKPENDLMEPTKDFSDFIDDELRADLDRVEEELLSSLRSEAPDLSEAALYLINAGGKRIRPAFILLAYRCVGGRDIEEAIPIAAAVEFIHTASLIHDDINDESRMRRGIPVTHHRFGNIKALVAGDFLFVKAFEIGGRYDYEIIKIIADACSNLAEGEILQNNAQYETGLDIENYLKIIYKKTGSLIAACLEIGAVLGKANKEQREALVSFGHSIGLAFQITDDVLDVLGEREKTGKIRGIDLREGQLSLPTIYALQTVSKKERGFLERVIKTKENTDQEIQAALEIIKESGAVDRSYETAMDYAQKAKAAVESLPVSHYRDHFELIVEYIIERCS